jgi:hypothetical protein
MNILKSIFNKFLKQKSYEQIYLENSVDTCDLERRQRLLDKGHAPFQRYHRHGVSCNGW